MILVITHTYNTSAQLLQIPGGTVLANLRQSNTILLKILGKNFTVQCNENICPIFYVNWRTISRRLATWHNAVNSWRLRFLTSEMITSNYESTRIFTHCHNIFPWLFTFCSDYEISFARLNKAFAIDRQLVGTLGNKLYPVTLNWTITDAKSFVGWGWSCYTDGVRTHLLLQCSFNKYVHN